MHRKKHLNILMALMLMAVIPLGIGVRDAQALDVGANGYYIPNYFGATPNWANSPQLAKFVDGLPGICGVAGATNTIGQCIPLAVPQTRTFNGVASDYYEIELVEYRERMHTGFTALNNADKMLATAGGTKLRGYRQTNTADVNLLTPHYLGPLILASKDKPVRIKFINKLPAGAGGKLFVPVDTTLMGAGPGPGVVRNQEDSLLCASNPNQPTPAGCFTENRANLHLHGGRSPWISDGTPHQWITPALDATTLKKGASVVNVPDMWFDSTNVLANGTYAAITACDGQTTCSTPGATNDPGPGSQTYYYTNQQSARLLFYHDHAWGITRLNVYAGGAAGYLITDPKEETLVVANTIPGSAMPAQYRYGIPLVIQDKTFVDATGTTGSNTNHILNTDPTWAWGSNPAKPATSNPVTGDLWWPHVYMPGHNPFNPDFSGVNPMGRWVYGPWFWPPTPICGSSPDAVKPLCIEYGTVPNQYAAEAGQPPEMPGTPNPSWGAEAFMDTMLVNGTAYPTVTVQPQAYRFRILNAAHDRFVNLQLYRAANKNNPTLPGAGPSVFTGPATDLTEVRMVPAAPTAGYPEMWPADGREGGVPDPDTRGPSIIQIGNESGFLPKPVRLPNQPVNWNVDPTLFTAGLVLQQNQGGGTLMLGPAERADVIIDFTKFSGHTLILYNDAPAPWPALDPHYDYYTGAPDRRAEMGGANTTAAGFGPNIRTIMQIVVAGGGDTTAPVDDYNATTLGNLVTAFTGTAGVFATSQDPIVVGQSAYDTAYSTTFPATWPEWGVSRISDNSLRFKNITGDSKIVAMKPKAIQDEMGEVFDDYGRMSAKLGLEVPFTNAGNNNFNLQNFVDPATEIVRPDEIQIWKITHNGVDTHPVHFHLFDVQVLNRVGWDGFIYLPDDNELGWKETVRVSPLEDTIVALRPIIPQVPFALPTSVRPLNPAMPINTTMGFSQVNPETGEAITPLLTNQMTNFGHEYVWHCHILSHEESDMMRPMILVDSMIYTASAAGDQTGLWVWELGAWKQIDTSVPVSIAASGTTLYADRNADGIWKWDGATWSKIAAENPENLVAADATVYADLGASGIWKYNGVAWSQLTPENPENMAASGSTLYADFGAGGTWKYAGGAWTKLALENPENMIASGSDLYVDFGTGGIWKYNGSAWAQLAPENPESLVVSGSTVYADLGAAGIWKYNGSAWAQLAPENPESIVASNSALYADFGAGGVWQYAGGAWAMVSPENPGSMVVSGSHLYMSLGAGGIWKYDGYAWSKVSSSNPAIMTAGF